MIAHEVEIELMRRKEGPTSEEPISQSHRIEKQQPGQANEQVSQRFKIIKNPCLIHQMLPLAFAVSFSRCLMMKNGQDLNSRFVWYSGYGPQSGAQVCLVFRSIQLQLEYPTK